MHIRDVKIGALVQVNNLAGTPQYTVLDKTKFNVLIQELPDIKTYRPQWIDCCALRAVPKQK